MKLAKSTICAAVADQPFCDGSHAETGIKPMKFTADKTGDVTSRPCKSSGNAPFCEGTHARLGGFSASDLAPAPKSILPTAVPTPEKPTVARIHEFARDRLSKLGRNGEMGATVVPRNGLPY